MAAMPCFRVQLGESEGETPAGGNVVLEHLYEEMLDTVEGGEASEAGNKFERTKVTDSTSTAGIYKGKRVLN